MIKPDIIRWFQRQSPILIGATFVVAFAAGILVHRWSQPRAKPEQTLSPVVYKPGTEILVVYFGSEDCGPSFEPGFNDVVRQALQRVEK